MDYRIFNVRTCSFLCVRMYTHRGLDTPIASQHNIFDSEKLSQMFLVLDPDADGVRTSGLSLYLESDALPTEPPRHTTVLNSVSTWLDTQAYPGWSLPRSAAAPNATRLVSIQSTNNQVRLQDKTDDYERRKANTTATLGPILEAGGEVITHRFVR